MAEFLETRPGRRRKCQFTVRSLIFITFVTAICAAMIAASAALAVILIPVVAMALFRTMRVVTTESQGKQHLARGLFGTFCQSVFLILSLIVVSVATAAVGTIACTVVLFGQFIRLIPPTSLLLRNCLVLVWWLTVFSGKTCQPIVSYLTVIPFRWTCDHAIALTTNLAGLDRRLLSRFCFPAGIRQ